MNEVVALVRPRQIRMEMESIGGEIPVGRPAGTLSGERAAGMRGEKTLDGHPATKRKITAAAKGSAAESRPCPDADRSPDQDSAADRCLTMARREIHAAAQSGDLFACLVPF